jgi:hypothetical protein
VLPCCRAAVLPCYRAAVLPCYRAAVLPCYRATVLPCYRGRASPSQWLCGLGGRRTAGLGRSRPPNCLPTCALAVGAAGAPEGEEAAAVELPPGLLHTLVPTLPSARDVVSAVRCRAPRPPHPPRHRHPRTSRCPCSSSAPFSAPAPLLPPPLPLPRGAIRTAPALCADSRVHAPCVPASGGWALTSEAGRWSGCAKRQTTRRA